MKQHNLSDHLVNLKNIIEIGINKKILNRNKNYNSISINLRFESFI